MFGFEGVEQINEVLVFDAEEDVALILEHLHFFGGGYGVLSDEF